MRKALENLSAVLDASGSSVDKVVKTTIFAKDLNDYASINEEYKKSIVQDTYKYLNINSAYSLIYLYIFYFLHKAFTSDFPARSFLQVAKLPLDACVEIEAIAVTGDVKTVY